MGLFSKKVKEVVPETMQWVMFEETKTRKTKSGNEVSYKSRTYKCSKCGYKTAIKTKYCPDCGRKAE